MQKDRLTSVEVRLGAAKLDFICKVEGGFLTSIFCYINGEDTSAWKTDRFEHEEQMRFLRMLLETYEMPENSIKEYSEKIMTCFENGIECILK